MRTVRHNSADFFIYNDIILIVKAGDPNVKAFVQYTSTHLKCTSSKISGWRARGM